MWKSRSPLRPVMSLAMTVALVAAACGADSEDVVASPDSEASTDDVKATDSTTAYSTTTAESTTAVDSAETADSTTAVDSTEAVDSAEAATSDASVEATSGVQDGDVFDTTAGVEAAMWANNVGIAFGDGTFTFRSDSLPSHELPDQILIPSGGPGDPNVGFVPTDMDTLLSAVELESEITLNPVYSAETTETSLGQIAVIISGAQLFNDYENMERTIVALDDQMEIDGVSFIDACNGHPLASGADYHYHGIPYCISDEIDVVGQHSSILGIVRDGFPVYANKDVGGVVLTDADLDECGGHYGPTPEFPDGIYHYHLTDDAAPYSIDCYHGVIDLPAGGGGAGGGGGRGDRPPRGEGPDREGPGGQAPDGAAPIDEEEEEA